MQVKHHHNCQMCNTQKSCFVFREFTILFAICRNCFDQMVRDMPTYQQETNFCSFCEKKKPTRIITGFPEALFFTDLRICNDCFQSIRDAIRENDETVT